MIIERTGNRTVRGLPGWEVEEQFPYTLEYREEYQATRRVLRLQAELTATADVSIILYDEPGAFRWQPPFQRELLSPAELHPILVRVTAAVLLLGVRPIWETMPRDAERTDWPVIWAEAQALLRRAG
jgi:hypothetical protein